MERQQVIGRVGEAITRAVFGPKVEGIVKLVLRDPHNRNYWHVLVETTGGKNRHFTLPHAAICVSQGKGFEIEEMSYRRGQHMEMRTRGTGLVTGPWSKIDRDPFNLKSHKTG